MGATAASRPDFGSLTGTANLRLPLNKMSLYICRYRGSKMFNTWSECGMYAVLPSGNTGMTMTSGCAAGSTSSSSLVASARAIHEISLA